MSSVEANGSSTNCSESFRKILNIHNNLNRSNLNNNNKCTARDSERATDGTIETTDHVKFSDKVFGWGKFQPKFLQNFCNAKWALFWLCWGGAMQGLIVNGFINVSISTIERRFGLRSRQTGLVASGYDIASFICLVPVSYFGGRIGASKPRWIAFGIILMGIGSLTFALPHLLVGPYRASFSELNTCQDEKNSTMEHCSDISTSEAEDENLSWNVWFFFAAQLLHGAGAAPLFTLGVTYIDENVSKKMSSVYLGIYYTMAIIGPAVGYVLGGQLLLIYTDFLTVDSATLGLTSQSKVWIGAWWIGFIFAALACILLSIPIFGYPKSLPGSEDIQQERISEAYNGKSEGGTKSKSFTKLRELPKALLSLLRNPTFFFLNLAGASEGLIIAGFSAFLPKQIENQFSISPVWSALLMGVITVPAGGGGTFLGGYLVKKFNLACSGIIRMCLIATVISTFFTICFLLTCPNLSFAGVTSAYSGVDVYTKSQGLQLEAACNSECHCSSMNYDPICGSDGVMYYSPCHAGCQQERALGSSKVYLDCECITAPENVTYEAINTMCDSNCTRLPYFMALCFVLMLFTFLATMPALAATLRCVHDDQRSFALGIQWIKVRLLGTIPSPMIFGALIDETCILWQKSCDEHGACLVYDNKFMSRFMWILALSGKISSVVFFLAAWWFYIPPKPVMENTDGVAVNSNDDNNSHHRKEEIRNENEQSQQDEQQVVLESPSIELNSMNETGMEYAQKVAHTGGRY